LPYEVKELSMVVLLPKQVDGLAAIEKSLGAAALAEWLGKMRRTEVVLTLPKFKTTAAFELNQTLAAMGMADAFSQTVADFSGMTAEERLFISKVIHKAFVDVGEEGTEAAAATAVAVAPMAMPMPAPEPLVQFRADHPFIYIIRHEPTGAILFMGRLADPTK
jgi:serpin B